MKSRNMVKRLKGKASEQTWLLISECTPRMRCKEAIVKRPMSNILGKSLYGDI